MSVCFYVDTEILQASNAQQCLVIKNECMCLSSSENILIKATKNNPSDVDQVDLDKFTGTQIQDALDILVSCKLKSEKLKILMSAWSAEFEFERNNTTEKRISYKFQHNGWNWVSSPVAKGCNLGWFTCWFEGFVNSSERKFIFTFDTEDRLSSAVTMLTGF